MPSLRQIRLARLLTIRELAQRAEVAPSTVYLLEAGHSRPTIRVIRQLSTALAVAPELVDEFREAGWLPDLARVGETTREPPHPVTARAGQRASRAAYRSRRPSA